MCASTVSKLYFNVHVMLMDAVELEVDEPASAGSDEKR